MYKQHPKLGYWASEDGFLMKQPRYKCDSGERKFSISQNGYAFISYKAKSYYVHRIIYEAFYGEIPNDLQINHINGDKLDNRIRNLELVTASENVRHAVKTGLKPANPGETNGMAKLTNEAYYQIIADIMTGLTNDQVAEKCGLHSRYISLVRGKKRLKTIWKEYELINGCNPIPRSSGEGSDVFEQKLKLLSELPYFTNKELALRYNVDPSTISRIRSKDAWLPVWDVFQGKVQRLAKA